MHNAYAIQVEAEFRQQEWQQAAAADARAALGSQSMTRPTPPRWPLAGLRALTAPLVAASAPRPPRHAQPAAC